MTLLQFIELHPWWTLIYACVIGSMLTGVVGAWKGK